MIKNYNVTHDYINCRLDRWYKKNICNVPQSLLEKSLRKGKIKVNKKKIKSSYKLKKDDLILINNFTPILKKEKKEKFKYHATKSEIKSASTFIIEDNENFVVVNKPAGIAVQSGTKSPKNILDILRNTKYFMNSSPFTVHRIDKETTGVLIVAKNRQYAQLFTSLFRIKKIHKEYFCIAIGEIEKKKGTLKDILTYKEGKKIINLNSVTHYNLIDSNRNYSLLKLIPETGRKHQLRKQLLMHNNPILGDSKYRISKTYNKNNQLMLHAYKIYFKIDNKKYEYIAELPDSFKKTLKEKYLKIPQ